MTMRPGYWWLPDLADFQITSESTPQNGQWTSKLGKYELCDDGNLEAGCEKIASMR